MRKIKNENEANEKTRIQHYETDDNKKQHTKDLINKSVEIIDRQFSKIGKIATGRTYIYNATQVTQLIAYLNEKTVALETILSKKVEEKKSFELGS